VASPEDAIHENSEQFLPAFARVPGHSDGRRIRYTPLDYHFLGRSDYNFKRHGASPVAGPDEQELGRWGVIGGVNFTPTPDGTPLRVAEPGATGIPTNLCFGAIELVLTDNRLLGAVVKGDTVVGPVGGSSGSVLLFVFPLSRIDQVNLGLKRKLFGGGKDADLSIVSVFFEPAALIIEDVVTDMPEIEGLRGKRGMLERLIEPVVAARRKQDGSPVDDDEVPPGEERHHREETTDRISVLFADWR